MVHSYGHQTVLKKDCTALRYARLVEKENVDLMRLYFESDVDLHCLVRTCELGDWVLFTLMSSIPLISIVDQSISVLFCLI